MSREIDSNVCRDYTRGICDRGDRCKFDHPDDIRPEKPQLCKDFLNKASIIAAYISTMHCINHLLISYVSMFPSSFIISYIELIAFLDSAIYLVFSLRDFVHSGYCDP